MGLIDDLLTWTGVRELASHEALNIEDALYLTRLDPTIPPIEWHQQRRYLAGNAQVSIPQAGDVLYARAAWRRPWREQLLAQVPDPIVLVTTYYDPTIKPLATDEMFVPQSPIAHWFGFQAMTTHPQFTAMPLGIEPAVVPLIQKTEQRAVRDQLLYLNFHLGHRHGHQESIRPGLWRHFAHLPWVTADPWRPQATAFYLQQLGRSRFVLSPPGFAWDCYRTYEAIAMGAIPIVKRHPPITDVCEDLPVLLIDDWPEITEEMLRNYQARPASTASLTMSYWRETIQAAAMRAREAVAA